MAGDPKYASVVLLLHCDDVAFPDTSSYAHVGAVTGCAANTSIKLFGAASLQAQFGSSAVAFNDAPEFDFSTGNWTIELAVYLPSGGAGFTHTVLNKRNAGNQYPYKVLIDSSNDLTVQGLDTGGNMVYLMDGGVIATDTWIRVAFQRSGNNYSLFMDGVLTDTDTNATALAVTIDPVTVGGGGAPYNGNFHGEVDEVRFTKGVARYTVNYTPAIEAFADSVGISPIAAYTDPNGVWFPLELAICMHSIRTIPGFNKHQLREAAQAAAAAGEPWVKRDPETKQYYMRRPRNG